MTYGQQSIFDLFPGPVTTIPGIITAISRLPPRAAAASDIIRQWVTEASPILPLGFQRGIFLQDDCGRKGIVRAMTRRAVDGHEAVAVLVELDDRFRRFELIQGLRVHPVLGLITPGGRHLLADLPGLMPIPGDCIGVLTWSCEDTQEESVEPLVIGTTVHLGDRWAGTTPATVVGYRGIWLAIAHGDEPIQILPVNHVSQFAYLGDEANAVRGLAEADQTACEVAASKAQDLRTLLASTLRQHVEQEIARFSQPLDFTAWKTLCRHTRALRESVEHDARAQETLDHLVKHLTWTHTRPNGTVLVLGPSQDEDRGYLQVRITIPELAPEAPWSRWISMEEAHQRGAWSTKHDQYLAQLAETSESQARKEFAQVAKDETKKTAASRKQLVARASALATQLTPFSGPSPAAEGAALVSRLTAPSNAKASIAALDEMIAQALERLAALVHPLVIRLADQVLAAAHRFEVPASADVQQLDDLRPFLPSSLHNEVFGATNAAALFEAAWAFTGRVKEMAPGEWAYLESGSCGWDSHGAISETGYRSISNLSKEEFADCDLTLGKLHEELLAFKAPKRTRGRSYAENLSDELSPSAAALILNRHAALPLKRRQFAIQQDIEDLQIADRIKLMHDGLTLIAQVAIDASVDPLAAWMESWESLRQARHRHHEHVIQDALDSLAFVVRHHLERALVTILPHGFAIMAYRMWGSDRESLALGSEHTLIDPTGKDFRFPTPGLRSNQLPQAITTALLSEHEEETGMLQSAILESDHAPDDAGDDQDLHQDDGDAELDDDHE